MKHRSPWKDPNVKARLAEGITPAAIMLICCESCGTWGYYNEGSHFSCSVRGCDWFVGGEALDAIIDDGAVISLDDYVQGAAAEFLP